MIKWDKILKFIIHVPLIIIVSLLLFMPEIIEKFPNPELAYLFMGYVLGKYYDN